MYRKHKVLLMAVFIVVVAISYFFKFQYSYIASDAINAIAITSAIYLAAYAGIQASPSLRNALKASDGVRKDKSQLYVINTYIKTALMLGVITIVVSCIVILISERINEMSILIAEQQRMESNILRFSPAWNHVTSIISLLGMGLFFIDLTLVWIIGVFIANRIAYNK